MNDKALAFLEDSLTDQEQPPVEFRLQWAQNERQAVINTLELERMRYRVASAVEDMQEKQAITQRVHKLLARLDEWDAIIGEIKISFGLFVEQRDQDGDQDVEGRRIVASS